MTEETLDTSDLDQYMGVPMEPGELKEPVAVNDIRRWVQGMHYPNPLHYDERWAEESRFGQIIAPQSFTVACDTSHGCSPAQVGKIPNSHLIFGGDDWWFFGPRIYPGDHLVCHRMPYDYKVTNTGFAGPTCFQRGDTLYINQRGERVAMQRSTSIRYQVR
ncbi:MAG TPA: MaoC family dehydratase N-terminal domain-containing protein, partial [Acidimicrobiales bacterium]|nr:MaoC family dehydratase N-terminal domain-containing protein [Acidimicrobiales bacterium]